MSSFLLIGLILFCHNWEKLNKCVVPENIATPPPPTEGIFS